MDSYNQLTQYFNTELKDNKFQSYLKENFEDLTDYNITESDYIKSKKYGIELGFKNIDAVYDEDDKVIFEQGNPVFTHFNLFPESDSIFDRLPFGINFYDKRASVIIKAGQPHNSNKGEIPILGKYLIDYYFVDDMIISFDYEVDEESIKFIQIKFKC